MPGLPQVLGAPIGLPAGSEKVTIGGPVFIVGNDSVVEPPLQVGRIEVRGATFTGKELLFGAASEAVYADVAVTNGVGGAFSAFFITAGRHSRGVSRGCRPVVDFKVFPRKPIRP